jgi:acetyltransferase-like isoleucine patch superfamily enzyme
VSIGAGAELRERASLVAQEEISLGANASLGEMSVVMDFAAPSGGAVGVPLRLQGVRTAPVSVGAGAVIGPKAVLEAGASVAEGAHVMAGATVEGGLRAPRASS